MRTNVQLTHISGVVFRYQSTQSDNTERDNDSRTIDTRLKKLQMQQKLEEKKFLMSSSSTNNESKVHPTLDTRHQNLREDSTLMRSKRALDNTIYYFSQNYYLFFVACILFVVLYIFDPVSLKDKGKNLSLRAKREEREID